MLKDIQMNYLAKDQSGIELHTKIKFIINKIGHKKIYMVQKPEVELDLGSPIKLKKSNSAKLPARKGNT